MKRLFVIVLFIFASIEALWADTDADKINPLKLQDCKIMLMFANLWQYTPLVERERAIWIVKNSNGQLQSISWLQTPQRNITKWHAPLPKGIVAQAHTHGDHLNAGPSAQDISVARRLSISVYVLSRKAIWRAAPDGSVTKEDDLRWYEKTLKQCGR